VITPSDFRAPSSATGLEIRPFRALTYRRRDPDHLARVSSPAYDLVSPTSRARLADADPHNIVRLILPLVDRTAAGSGAAVTPGDAAPTTRSAEQAADTLARWLDQDVLERDDAPALWLYELRPPAGIPATVGWIGAVALPAGGSSAVLPHEDTYPVAVEGRRALLAATATDLEPIVLSHDPEPVVAELTDLARKGPPTLELRDTDGVEHRLWRVADPDILAALTEALGRTDAVIADGHHRFAAARANSHRQPALAGSDAILALVTPMGPGGLRVDPIHRVVPDLTMDAAVDAASQGFRITELPVASGAADIAAAVRRWLDGDGRSGFLITDGHRLARLDDPGDAVLAAVPSEAPAAWRGLDVVLAHHGLLDLLWHRHDDAESVLIAHTVDAAVAAAVERGGVALLLRAPSPTDVAAVARAGARMPRKSTLFMPKPRTGLVLRPLAD
jgi:uncharacterized protein (DUF1015 family)